MATETTGTDAFESLDVLIVPSPILSEDAVDFPEVDPANGLYVGGRARLEAAVEFSLRHEPRLIMVVGGIHPTHGNRMTAAMRQFIVERDSRANVLPMNSLPCTRHNVIALFNQVGKQLVGKRVAVLTSEYHLPRFLAFWSQLRRDYDLRIADPLAIAAETICDATDAQEYLAAINARYEAEQRGLRDLQAGKYADRCLGELASFGHALTKHADEYLSRLERVRWATKTRS